MIGLSFLILSIYLIKLPMVYQLLIQLFFVDSNAMNIIDNFRQSPQDYKNSFLDFEIKYDIDLNCLPYLLEDYINPEHEGFNLNKTRSKIESFEIVNNLDKEFYYKTGQIRIDQKKLESRRI